MMQLVHGNNGLSRQRRFAQVAAVGGTTAKVQMSSTKMAGLTDI
jgi:hypothetical protein